MKNLPLSIGFFCVGIFLYTTFIDSPTSKVVESLDVVEKVKLTKDPTRPELQQRIEGRYQQEWDMTHDPSTGTVPKERLNAARAYTQLLLSRKAAIPNVNWDERGPNNVSGRTRSILIDAGDPSHNTIFSGGVAGGIWRSVDGAANWTQIDDFFDNLAIGDITQDPNNSDIIYFGTGEGYGNIDAVRGLGIWKSTDGGLTFDQLPSTDDNPDFHYVNSMVCVDLGSTTAVLSGNRFSGVFRSIDEGLTWTLVLAGTVADMTVASNGDVFAGMDNDGIYRSTDGGVTWTEEYNNTNSDGRIELNAAPSDPNIAYALLEGNGNLIPTIRRTSDGGDSWDLITNPLWNDQNCNTTSQDWSRGQDWYDLTVAVDPNDPNRVFIGAVDLFATEDGGQSWTQVSSWIGICGRPFSHADQHALVFAPGSSDILYNGNDGGIYKSVDASQSMPDFEFMGNGYNITQFYAVDIHPDAAEEFYIGGTQDNGTQQFIGPGLVNTSEATGGDGGFCHIDQNDPSIVITSFTRNNYSISLDGGTSFSFGPSNNTGRFINPTDYDDDTKVLYGASNAGQCFRWLNPSTGGANASQITITNLTGQISAVRVSPNVSDRVYFASNGNIYRVNNASTTNPMVAQLIYQGPNNFISSIEIDPSDENHIVFTVSNFGVVSVFETQNSISLNPSWNSIEGNLPDIPVRWASFNPNNFDQLLIGTELGVWSTDDIQGPNNTDWAPTNANLANVRVDMLKYRTSDNAMIAGTHGRGMFSTRTFNNQLFFDKRVSATVANALDVLTYEIEIFNNLLVPITNVEVTDVLDPGLIYVDGSLTCGTISGSTITINEATIAPGQTITCTFQAQLDGNNFSVTIFEDQIENGTGNWTIVNNIGAATWSTATNNANSPSTSWFSPNTGQEDNTNFLILDEMTITTDNLLSFWHDYNTENGWDGGFVEISTDGGISWVDLESNFVLNGYTGVLGTNQNTDINGRSAFTGSSDGYIQSLIDLSSFQGQNAQIRFVFGEDDNTFVEGWYIDDVELIEQFVLHNEACLSTAEGDNLCSVTNTVVFECEVNCFSCDDGILNGDEEEVDCGGSMCMACPTCDDGVLNGEEEEVDCGGPECPVCPTCDDGIKNGDEDDVDCGGSVCTACPCTDIVLVYDGTSSAVAIPDGTDRFVRDYIQSQGEVTVQQGTMIELRAGQFIEVMADFEVAQGGELLLDITNCDDSSIDD